MLARLFVGISWQHKPTVYSLIIWSTLWSTLGLTKIFDELVIIFRKGCGVWTFPTLFPSFSIQIIFPSLGSSFLKSFHKPVSKLFWLGCGPTTPRIEWPQLCSWMELELYSLDFYLPRFSCCNVILLTLIWFDLVLTSESRKNLWNQILQAFVTLTS